MDSIKLEQLFQEADQHIKDKFFDQAVAKLNEILGIDPNFGKAYNHLGWMYETKFHDLQKAEEYYKLALEKSPEYLSLYYNYAILLSTLNKFDELSQLLEKAATKPGISLEKINNEYAIMYEKMGQYEKAIHYYKLYAQHTFTDLNLKSAKDSISRCNSKMSL